MNNNIEIKRPFQQTKRYALGQLSNSQKISLHLSKLNDEDFYKLVDDYKVFSNNYLYDSVNAVLNHEYITRKVEKETKLQMDIQDELLQKLEDLFKKY